MVPRRDGLEFWVPGRYMEVAQGSVVQLASFVTVQDHDATKRTHQILDARGYHSLSMVVSPPLFFKSPLPHQCMSSMEFPLPFVRKHFRPHRVLRAEGSFESVMGCFD